MIRDLLRIARHTAAAALVSAALGILALQVSALGGWAGHPPDPYPYRLEVRLSEARLPLDRTGPLLEDLTRRWPGQVDVVRRAEGTWLVIRAATRNDRQLISGALDGALEQQGFSRSAVRLSSRWADEVAEVFEDPAAAAARYAALLPIVLAAGSAGFAITGWWLRRRHPEPAWEMGTISPLRATVIGLGVAGVALVIMTGLELVMRAIGAPVQEQDWIPAVVSQGRGAVITLLVLAVGVAPLGEELFFRGHVFRHLVAREYRLAAYVCSAGVFAAAHGNNPSGFPAYFLYGLILAWAFERWRSLLIPIVAHATVNAVAIGLLVAG